MKNIITALIVLLITLPVFAGELQVNSKGELRTATEEWRVLTSQEKEAIENPGEKIPLWGTSTIERESFLRGRELKKASEALVFYVSDNPHE
jgi:hypothetical protein